MRKIALIGINMFSSVCLAGNLFSVSGTQSQLTISTTTDHFYKNAGIQITSGNFSLSNSDADCAMIANGYCFFSVGQNSPKNIGITGTGNNVSMRLCLNARGPVSCQQYNVSLSSSSGSTITDYVYIVNSLSNSVTLCEGSSNGTLGNCSDSGATNLGGPRGIARHPSLNVVYIANSSGNAITYCNINTTTKKLENCVSNSGLGLNQPSGLAVGVVSLTPYLYVTNFGSNLVKYCQLDGATGAITSCTDATSSFGTSLYGIALNPTASIAYVSSNGTHQLYKCDVGPGTPTLSCALNFSFSSPSLNPELMTFVASTFPNYLYVPTNGDGAVQKCELSNIGGNINTCTALVPGLSDPKQTVLNNVGNYAFTTNEGSNSVTSCTYDALTGDLAACTNSGATGLSAPSGILVTSPT